MMAYKIYSKQVFITSIILLCVFSACKETSSGPEQEVIDHGAIEVLINTAGEDLDKDGYTIILDHNTTFESAINDTLTFLNVSEGSHEIAIEEFAENCSIKEENPLLIDVLPADTLKLNININCEDVVLVNKIVFHRSPLGLFIMNPDGSDVKQITDNRNDGLPVISPDGKTIVFTNNIRDKGNYDFNFEIYKVDASGEPLTRVTETEHKILNTWPTWSPDGEQIVFSRTDNNGNGRENIATMSIDGILLKNLTESDVDDRMPSWSPDGNKIAFSSTRNAGRQSIYVMNSNDGTNVELLIDVSTSDQLPRWSPDGSKIAFTGLADGSLDIFVMNSDGSDLLNITNDDYTNSHPVWSPNGTQIAFVRHKSTKGDIYIINIDGTGLTNITNTPDFSEAQPHWSPVTN